MEQNNALARKFNAASLLRFALPNIAMMMLLSMYTIVDGMFISRFAGPRFPQSICRIRSTACRWLPALCSARAAALLSPADRERDAQTRRAATSPC